MEIERVEMLLRGQRPVKTTNHVHPVLNHNSISAKNQELKKKSTTSPASTLSDKGIGSSVGSFDSEFRHDSSVSCAAKLSYDSAKTGSLDSRTQETTEKSIPAHTRSSSDIICQSVTSDKLEQPSLAKQSSVTLWNRDPRRLSSIESDTLSSQSATLTASVRPRKPVLRRQRSRNDSSIEREADIKKLPQLCRDSVSQSSVSCSQSTTPTISTADMGSNSALLIANGVSSEATIIPSSESIESFSSKSASLSSHPPSPFFNDVAPPLPPKASHLQNRAHSVSSPINQNSSALEKLNQSHFLSVHRPNDYKESALPSRETLAPNSTSHKPAYSSGVHQPNSLWSNDTRREVPVALSAFHQTQLSSALGSGIGKAESVGQILQGNEKLSVAKFHGSTSALLDAERSSNPNNHTTELLGRQDGHFNRHTVARTSTRSNHGERNPTPIDTQVRASVTLPPVEVALQALRFDLPQAITSELKFVGREWLFNDILSIFSHKDSNTNKVAILVGNAGHGKTSIINHIVSLSYQGGRAAKFPGRPEHEALSRANSSMYRSSSPLIRTHHQTPQHFPGSSNHSSRTGSPAPSFASGPSSKAGSQVSLNEETCRKLASQVVAYHFCQADSNVTCFVPEFVHSIAAQMTQAPQLTAYREIIMNDQGLRSLLSIRNCILNPVQALHKSILEPLISLRKDHKLPKSNLIILVDAVNEADQHKPDYGFSILSFLKEQIHNFPDFIKIVITCRTGDKDLVLDLPGESVTLDCDNRNISRDMQLYVSQRVSSSTVLSNLTLSGKSDPTFAQKQLTQHLLKVANGNFLYLRMTLDLMDREVIVPKSTGFTTVPTDLCQLFLLQCNLRFRSYTSFNEYRDVISVALASLYPLKDEQLYQAVCSNPNELTWRCFKEQMEVLDGLLVQNPITGVRAFFHSLFREWLIGILLPTQGTGTLNSINRYKVDVKRGYFLLANVLSRQPPERLHKHATLELAHHVLKAGMFKGQSKETGYTASQCNAQFMAACTTQLTEALICPRNLFYPSMKVSKLLLRAGANPNMRTNVFCNAPSLAVAAHNGWYNLVELLLMFEADVNLPASNGMSALTFAAAAGRLDVIELLLKYNPILSQADQNGHTPLLHAISRNRTQVAKQLLSSRFYQSQEQLNAAAQEGLVAAATTGNIDFIEFLLENRDLNCDVNTLEPVHGESPLTSAAIRGKANICEFLVCQYRANLYLRNKAGLTPLLCAIKSGEWDAANMLLNCGADLEGCDPSGKTPLIMAAYQGHLGLLELLMSRGADVQAADKEGLTALGWSALKGHAHCVRSLIGRSNVIHCDVSGRMALDLAAFYGDPQIVDLLLNAGADIRHCDATGMSALDRAIGCQNVEVVKLLLARGAIMQDRSWSMANNKPEISSFLISHALEEGNSFYKQTKFDHAIDIYASALKHVGIFPLDGNASSQHIPVHREICAHLLLGYSRCSRKLDALEEAELSATRALELKPHWYEALYARSRVLRERSRLKAALSDVMDAERTAPAHNLKEIRRLIERIKEEIRKNGSRYSRPPSISSEINIPQARPRLNSSSSCHGNPIRGRSPSPPAAELSRSYQSRSFIGRLVPYTTDTQRLIRGNSQESLAESMASLSVHSNYPIERRNNSVRRAPRTNPHWRPQVAELSRSLSVDSRSHAMRYRDNMTPPYPDYSHHPPHSVTSGNTSRPPLVTDL